MNLSVPVMPDEGLVRVKLEDGQTFPVKSEPSAIDSLYMIPTKKRKHTEEERGNELFVRSSRGATPAVSVNKKDDREHTEDEHRTRAPEFKSAWAPIRKKAWMKRPAANVTRIEVNTRVAADDLYMNLDINKFQKVDRSNLVTMRDLKRLIQACLDARNDPELAERSFMELREKIHKMEFYPWVNGKLLKESKVLEPGILPRIYDGPDASYFPWDIKADATALWRRWEANDLDFDLLRGIKTTKETDKKTGKKNTSHKIVDAKFKKSALCVGDNGLVNGQWWPSRLACLRDGAHGETEAGICGRNGEGAYSIVIANGGYNDRDDGESVEYCGTRGELETPSKHTELLRQTRAKRQPLRVLRAVHAKSKYAPKEGIRYDGMYEITDFEIVSSRLPCIASRFAGSPIKIPSAIRASRPSQLPRSLLSVPRFVSYLHERPAKESRVVGSVTQIVTIAYLFYTFSLY
ncbi:YDG/SRA domain-containing protein [Phlyctema vagabunda]|uniref:YDG/SRA domain-containing protein n=1 Tax=Phlyctema vagabunda TaxID=108571 RepID=A0ABR4PJK1_9HELO